MTYGNYPDLSLVKKILVVKLRHHGDVLLSSPVFSLLKKALPHASIDAYIYRDTAAMLEGHSAIDEIIFTDRKKRDDTFLKRIGKEIKLLLKIRKKKYDLIINLTEGDRGAIVAAISGSRYKVGFARKGKNRIYSHVIKNCSKPRHTVEKQLDALRCIGIFPKKEERDLNLNIPSFALEKAKELTEKASSYVVIHPVSRWRFKCLPSETMASVANALAGSGKKVFITAGPSNEEMEMVSDIMKRCAAEGIVSLAGKTSLKELAAVIAMAEMLVTVDSVPLHIASAVKTPVVALFGPTSEENWGPWMHPRACVLFQAMPCRPCFADGCAGSKMSDCLHTLSVEKIIGAIEQLSSSDLPILV